MAHAEWRSRFDPFRVCARHNSKSMKRIAITGSSGYLGECLIRHLATHEPDAAILGIDVVPPKKAFRGEFLDMDVRSQELSAAVELFRPDTLVHLAFVVPPMHDERTMREINVVGSRNVFEAAASAGVERLLVASSATVFGARADNPVPIDENWPGRADDSFRYAANKVELESMLVGFAPKYPAMAVSCLRPCIVAGPNMDNYLRRLLLEMPLIVLLDRVDSAIQLVHEDDVSDAILRILRAGGRGAYNIAAPDAVLLSEMAEWTGRPKMSAPFWLAKSLAAVAWKLRFPPHEYPAAFLNFVRFPWIVSSNRLVAELGFKFSRTSRETLLEMVQL
jgi:UDP-glucose 4-epimerase